MHLDLKTTWRSIKCTSCASRLAYASILFQPVKAPRHSSRAATFSQTCVKNRSKARSSSSVKHITRSRDEAHDGSSSSPKNNERRKKPKFGHGGRKGENRGTFTQQNIKRLARTAITHERMVSLIMEDIDRLRTMLTEHDFMLSIGLVEESAKPTFEDFVSSISSLLETHKNNGESWRPPKEYLSLRQAYEKSAEPGLQAQLQYMLQGHVANQGFGESDLLNHSRLADFRFPYEWYTPARELQRHIHVHIGPTNSGKTYHALKRLEQADSGLYAGPLRLLAHEVYSRLNAKGKRCDLITGDERIISDGEGNALESCTVEMVPTGKTMDVAVIDEIQMIGHEERGWAWTQALLGLRAKEIHLCGEERALPLIRELAAAMGDTLHVHRYERLTPLKTMTTSLDGDLKKLRKGDCLVIFSRHRIHALKEEIEEITGKKVAVVYGSLPPEVRAQQARLFNEEDNDYDILVATDAVGMGLNLSIKRMVFESTSKVHSGQRVVLPISDIKQIAGRAGRFRVAPSHASNATAPLTVDKASSDMTPSLPGTDAMSPDKVCTDSTRVLGLVTSLKRNDLDVIRRAMKADATPILSAGILPPDAIIVRFASYFPPRTPFSYILLRLHEISRLQSRFHLCKVATSAAVADVLQNIEGLSIPDRISFCAAPVALQDPGLAEVIRAYAKCVERQSQGTLLSIPVLDLELLEYDGPFTKEYIWNLELLHKALILYLWLSYRFNGIFTSQAMAFHVKKLVEERIDNALAGRAHIARTQADLRSKEKAMLEQSHDHVENVPGLGDVGQAGSLNNHGDGPIFEFDRSLTAQHIQHVSS